jgi:charged multivesicular body protein 7
LIPTPSGQSENNRFVLESSEELLGSLQTSEYGRPLALGAVLQDAINSRALIPLKEFLESRENLYHKSWIPTPWQVVTWSLRQIGIMGDANAADTLVKGNFVVVANLEEAAKVVLNQVNKSCTSDAERLFSVDLFNTTFASALGMETFSPNDMSVLLKHLARDRNAIYYAAPTRIIKFKAPGQQLPSPITSEDESITSLRTLISTFHPQIEYLTSRIAELDKIARAAVVDKQLIKAKNTLRQKKLSETKLQQRSNNLAQLEDLYMKIQQAADQVQIVRVLESSGQALRRLNAQTGGVEKVHDVMEELKESMMETEEIGNAINEVAMNEIDEGAVDDELEALEMVEREREAAKKRVDEEAKEAKEKENLEAEEADQTRLRLAELDSFGKEDLEVKGDDETGKVSA